MALLAFVGNGGEDTGRLVLRDPRQGRVRNPPAFAGPAISLLPHPPFIGLSLGTMGWIKNPISTFVVNPLTDEVRAYELAPHEAVYEASGRAPLHEVDGWVRGGVWIAPSGRRVNGGIGPGHDWAYRTIEMIWQSRFPEGPLFEHQPFRSTGRPALMVNRQFYEDLHARDVKPGRRRARPVSSNETKKLRIAASRNWERWKTYARQQGLERIELYDEDHSQLNGWFALDIPAALDLAWVNTGTPHPLSHMPGSIGGGVESGYAREVALLEDAIQRAERAEVAVPSIATLRARVASMPPGPQRDFYEGSLRQRELAFPSTRLRAELATARAWASADNKESAWAKLPDDRKAREYAVRPVMVPLREAFQQRGLPRKGPTEPVWVGAPGTAVNPITHEGRRRNRDSKWKTPPDTFEIPLEEIAGNPTFPVADKKYKRFHQIEPTKAVLFRIPDGKTEVTRDPDIHVVLHETLETPYRVTWPSQKRGADPGNPIVWFHEHPEGGRPLKVLNPRTGITSDLGGSYVVDDYWYS